MNNLHTINIWNVLRLQEKNSKKRYFCHLFNQTQLCFLLLIKCIVPIFADKLFNKTKIKCKTILPEAVIFTGNMPKRHKVEKKFEKIKINLFETMMVQFVIH